MKGEFMVSKVQVESLVEESYEAEDNIELQFSKDDIQARNKFIEANSRRLKNR